MASGDWQVLLACAADGGLPALVEAASGPGRVLVFAGTLDDRRLLASPGLAAFASALVRRLQANPPAPVAAPAGVQLRVARHQPGALTAVEVNSGAQPAEVLLAYRVRTWWDEPLASGIVAVRLPAAGASSVALPERDPLLGDPTVRRAAEEEPWRRVSVAVLDQTRSRELVRLDDVPVCREGPLALDIEDDPAAYDDLAAWAMPVELHTIDGRVAKRHVWRPGQQPRLVLRVRHGLLNLAPLATVSDRQWPQNPSSIGLTDRSFSTSNLRGALPLQGGWSGRPSATQALRLEWEQPVLIAAHRLVGHGTHCNWQAANPRSHRVVATTATGERVLAEPAEAAFAARRGEVFAWHEAALPTTVASALELRVHGLDATANREPHHVSPSNCALAEWEVLGWPAAAAPAGRRVTIIAEARELPGGPVRELLRQELQLAGGTASELVLPLPVLSTRPLLRVEVRLEEAGRVLQRKRWSAVVVAEGGLELQRKDALRDSERGLLCSPGWVATLGFGLGMRAHTKGWGGEDDKVWAWTHEQREESPGSRPDPRRLLVSSNRLSHYTNPWRDLPDGRYNWDVIAPALQSWMQADPRRGKRLWVVGSDRWNGVPIHVTWGWGEFLAFDRHLRATGQAGLRGSSRAQLQQEITDTLGDRWQRWQLSRYAASLQRTQDAFRAAALDFTFETHGSFPLCGGELGAALARTHKSVGTDLFWELRNQDLLWSVGSRFGLVAVNPDLESGAYGQWGWTNSEQNVWWFANNGAIEPARRQWYAAYFAGRVDLGGVFKPYHVLGYGSQGSMGVRMGIADLNAFARTSAIVGRLRPEAPAGFGVAVSWAAQERAMGGKLGGQGFGLYPSPGGPDAESLVGETWSRLAKAGLPLGWVTSTHGLRAWKGTAPLLCVDPARW